jgi:hypothetical protein
LSAIRRYHLSKFEQKLTGQYSSATIRDTLAAVQQVFNFAVRNYLLDYNPTVGYRKPAWGRPVANGGPRRVSGSSASLGCEFSAVPDCAAVDRMQAG